MYYLFTYIIYKRIIAVIITYFTNSYSITKREIYININIPIYNKK